MNSFEEFYADWETYRKVVRAFGDAGCRYLQLDEVYMIVLVDPKQRQFFVEHGNDPTSFRNSIAGRPTPRWRTSRPIW